MSFLTTAHLLDKYGPLLSEKNLAEVLHMEPGTVRNQRGSRPWSRQERCCHQRKPSRRQADRNQRHAASRRNAH